MGYTLHITEAAEDDIREAFLWYEEQKPELGKTFEQQVSNAIGDIIQNPFIIQIRYGATRVHFLRKFPYGIHFTVDESLILVLAVFHTARDPQRWQKRG